MNKMTPMEALKAATGSWHDALEAHAQSRKIMDLSLSRTGFERLLSFQYSLHQAVEPVIIPLLDAHWPALAYGETRQKLAALEKDMQVLAPANSPPLVDESQVDFLQSPYHALGCAYVLEGSTLGGQVILRHLKQIPEIAEDAPFHYYGLYADQVGPRWKVFQETANAALDTEEKVAEAVNSAVETFKLACAIYEMMEPASVS
jgi:heme oxygenase (biliverdin-IX-beta and delta-forming)